jgi:hypothetical protein
MMHIAQSLVGRSCQLRHRPANGGAGIGEVNFKTRLSQVQRGLHPADARADDEYRADFTIARIVCHRQHLYRIMHAA